VLEADPKGNGNLTIWAIESRNFICQGLDCQVAPPLLTINKEMRMEAVKRALEVQIYKNRAAVDRAEVQDVFAVIC
jgi:hypothetical protein